MKLKNFLFTLLFAFLSVCIFSCTANTNQNGKTEQGEDTEQDENTEDVKQPEAPEDFVISAAQELVSKMGIGINLGNTLEACGDWIDNSSPSKYETAWGSPVITQPMIQGYVDAGFKSLRIPVAWSNMMKDDGNYEVNPAYLERVHQIVKWALDCGLYVILNEHWDGGWWEDFPTKKEESMKHYKSIWNTVMNEFKNYGDHLIFESLNEEGGWDSVWDVWKGGDKKASYDLLNEINQTFVDMVRASGGNNGKRLLLIAGYNTGIDRTCDPLYKMPDDPANMCAVSVHYYSPAPFAILDEDADWGKNQTTWGTEEDISYLISQINLMKTTFVDKGIPVIIGEFGCPDKNKDPESVRKYLKLVSFYAYKNYMCPVLWDTPSGRYDRKTCKMADPLIEANFREVLETGRTQN